MSSSNPEESAVKQSTSSTISSDGSQTEPKVSSIDDSAAQSKPEPSQSMMSSEARAEADPDWAVEPSVGSAGTPNSSAPIEPEIPDIEESKAEREGEADGDNHNRDQRSRSSSRSSSPASSVTSPTSTENNEAAEREAASGAAPPLPNEPLPHHAEASTAPLPSEPVPEPEDDGWEYHWNPSTSSYWFYNRFTQVWQVDNPRLAPTAAAPTYSTTAPGVPQPAPVQVAGQPISDPTSLAGGYNPAIHGDYDPNAWYAQAARSAEEQQQQTLDPAAAMLNPEYASAGLFNRATGQWQRPEQGVERHSDEAKSKRQMNSFFDVDAAANEHDGRSLKAERAGKKPTKAELKAYKEKRRVRKEEKRRAWLRD